MNEALDTSLASRPLEAGAAPAGALRIALHEDWRALEAPWRSLEAEGNCTVFQSFDWADAWYESTRRHGLAKPLIVTVEDADGIAWILPLCRYRRRGLSFISFADLGVSDYAAPVMARDGRIPVHAQPSLIRSILRALPRCDLVHFQKLVDLVEGRANPLLQLPGLVAMRESAFGISIDRPWAELARKIMQPRLRSTIRQQRKKIGKLGPLTLTRTRDPREIGAAIDRLMSMRRTRVEKIGRSDMPPEWRAFYHGVATRPDRRLEVCVTTLWLGEEPIATCFGLTRGVAYHVILPTFAPDPWESYRPGMLLFDAMLEEFGPQAAFRGYFDFTIGDEPYKHRFGADAHRLMEYMAPRSPKGGLAYLYWRAKAAMR